MSEARTKAFLIALWGWIAAVWQGVRVAAVIAGALAAVVAAVCLILYIDKCKPKWCFDWYVMLWQGLLQAGFLFFYYGSCEACLPFGVIGALLMFAGVVLLIHWVISCRPRPCRILFEFASIGALNHLLMEGAVYWALGACAWHYGWAIHAIWNWMSFLAGVGAVACLMLSKEYNMVASEDD